MASRHIGLDAIQMIPLSSAYLCQDCRMVGNLSTLCPACGSGALLTLATVMDREVEIVLAVAPVGTEALCGS